MYAITISQRLLSILRLTVLVRTRSERLLTAHLTKCQ